MSLAMPQKTQCLSFLHHLLPGGSIPIELSADLETDKEVLSCAFTLTSLPLSSPRKRPRELMQGEPTAAWIELSIQ